MQKRYLVSVDFTILSESETEAEEILKDFINQARTRIDSAALEDWNLSYGPKEDYHVYRGKVY